MQLPLILITTLSNKEENNRNFLIEFFFNSVLYLDKGQGLALTGDITEEDFK